MYPIYSYIILVYCTILYNILILFFISPGGTITKSDGSTEGLNDNNDLWWSVLGGGGGTYGIIIDITYQLQEPPTGNQEG